jgi:hypothetical protein
LGVEFYAVLSEFLESFLEVGYELVSVFRLDYDVIHVCLNGLSNEITKTFKHTLLVGCSCVLQTEHHANITVRSERHDERSRELVGLFHRDLMVARVCIKEAEGFAP